MSDIVLYRNDSNWSKLPIRQYSESSAPDFIPRISGEMDQSNLDTTLQVTLRPQGSFQPLWEDSSKAYLSYGYYNQTKAALYPVIPLVTTGQWFGDSVPFGAVAGASTKYTAKAVSYNFVLIALREGSTNKLVKVDGIGNCTEVTLPAAISSSSSNITGITFHKDMAFISGQMLDASNTLVSFNTHRYNPIDGTFQDIGTPVQLLTSMRNVLYGVGYNSHFVTITNEFAGSAATYTSVAFAYPTLYRYDKPLTVVDFNGALWLAKESSLWRFDGTSATKVLDLKAEFLTVFQGAMYFRSGGYLCRFTGTLFEKLEYFGAPEDIEDIGVHQERLLILTSGTGNGFTPIQGAYTATHLYRLWSYDGTHFSCLYEKSGTPDVSSEQIARYVFVHKNIIWICVDESATTTWNLYRIDEATRFNSISSDAHVTTSDFTAGFENVHKVIRRLEVDVLDAGSNDTVTIKYMYSSDGKTWSAILTAGTLSSLSSTSTSNYIDLQQSSITNLGKRFRFFVTLSTSSSNAALRSLTVHYNISPQHRRRVTATLPLTYTTEHPYLVDSSSNQLVSGTDFYLGTSKTTLTPANAYSLLLQAADPSPSFIFMTPWRTTLNTAIASSSTTSIVIKGHLPLNLGATVSEDLTEVIAVRTTAGWEIMRAFTSALSSTTTTLTVSRGQFNSSAAASISAGAEIRIGFLANLRILNNSLILDDTTQSTDSLGATQIASDVTIELTEV